MKPTIRYNWDKQQWEASPNSQAEWIGGFNPAHDAAQAINMEIWGKLTSAVRFKRYVPYRNEGSMDKPDKRLGYSCSPRCTHG